MTYATFKETLLTGLKGLLPFGTALSIQAFSHNNSITLDGLTILEPDSNISPTIYLDPYFEQYQKGIPISEIIDLIFQYYQNHRLPLGINTSFFTNFENIQSRIVYKLIHFQKNKALLSEVPYIPFLDLAIVFYCLLSESPSETASILIHKEHLDYWNATTDTLFQLAQQNTPFLLSSCCNSLSELLLPVLEQLSAPEQEDYQKNLSPSSSLPMYVLTNLNRLNGACCILYKDALKEIAERLDSDLYILPSSIHEVILIPSSVGSGTDSLTEMICDINQSEVNSEEILSDHVYYYSRVSNRVSM